MSRVQAIDFSVTVPGKVILHGEHSVVYGKTALAASLNLKTELKFTTKIERELPHVILELPCLEFTHDLPVKDLQEFFKKYEIPLLRDARLRSFSLNSPDSIDFDKLLDLARLFLYSHKILVTGSQESAMLSFICLFWGMFASVDVPLPSCLIRITSELDIGAGMGSSSAYNVCLAAAFLQYIRRSKLEQLAQPCEISKEDYKSFTYWMTDLKVFEAGELNLISHWGLFGDKVMHGNPSGIDNAVCTYGSVIEFKKSCHGPDIKIIRDPKFLKILLVNTKIPRNTKKLVSHVASLKNSFSCIVEPILQAMDSVALSAAEVLRRMSQMSDNFDPPNSNALEDTLSREIEKLEELIDINQKLLEALGVSHDTLENICRIAKIEGLHGKLTGAGGGGYAYVILPFRGYDKQLCAVKMNYEKHHFPVQQVTLGGSGVTLDDISLSPTFLVTGGSSESSVVLSDENIPSPSLPQDKKSSKHDTNKQNTNSKNEKELDEWSWPFDLREVVKNMFETHVKEDLQAGEIAIPLRSLCAVNVPEPLPQWMDKVTKLQDQIRPTWRNILREGQELWGENENDLTESSRKNKFNNGAVTDDFSEQYKQRAVPCETTTRNNLKGKLGNIATLEHQGQRISKLISPGMEDHKPDLKSIMINNTDYHIPKQASCREKLYKGSDQPTKWLKDQFPPHGNREWQLSVDIEENIRQTKLIQGKHKKFLKHQKPGCEYFRNAFLNDN